MESLPFPCQTIKESTPDKADIAIFGGRITSLTDISVLLDLSCSGIVMVLKTKMLYGSYKRYRNSLLSG